MLAAVFHFCRKTRSQEEILRSLIAFLLMIPITPAQADDTLTLGQCFDINSGLHMLDSYERVIKDDKGEHSALAQYKLGNARITIALDQAALRPFSEALETTRQGIVAEIAQKYNIKPKEIEAGSAANVEYLKQYSDARNQPCTVKLGRIPISELKLGDGEGQNAIPPGALALIAPIIDREK